MTEMESPLENYADGLRFHFDGYEICRLLYRRIGDALRVAEKLQLQSPLLSLYFSLKCVDNTKGHLFVFTEY